MELVYAWTQLMSMPLFNAGSPDCLVLIFPQSPSPVVAMTTSDYWSPGNSAERVCKQAEPETARWCQLSVAAPFLHTRPFLFLVHSPSWIVLLFQLSHSPTHTSKKKFHQSSTRTPKNLTSFHLAISCQCLQLSRGGVVDTRSCAVILIIHPLRPCFSLNGTPCGGVNKPCRGVYMKGCCWEEEPFLAGISSCQFSLT